MELKKKINFRLMMQYGFYRGVRYCVFTYDMQQVRNWNWLSLKPFLIHSVYLEGWKQWIWSFCGIEKRTVRKMVAGCKYHFGIWIKKYAISSNNDKDNTEVIIRMKDSHMSYDVSGSITFRKSYKNVEL